MNTSATCASCHQPLTGNPTSPLCNACLGRIALLEDPAIDLQIEGFTIMGRLGEGGMAEVFLAEQTAPVRREVAVKVIKPGMDTRELIARFGAEQQALALMDHPHIARVYGAGSTRTGRPYFYMDYVEGLPLTEWCRTAKPSLKARLTLFVQICRAVQHAHQKGVIHRDLKPSNLLVIGDGPAATPKIIDFGVAKAVQGSPNATATMTGVGQALGTPLYMSPEQAAGSGDIDTRSDIYSLGVVLHELLTGETPFEAHRQAPVTELLQVIRDPQLRLPSSLRPSTPDGIAPGSLAGDLDAIILHALEKDRDRRYPTVDSVAADVESHLENKPVNARPPSSIYYLRKFTRRHRLPMAVGGLILASILGASAVSLWQMRHANAQREVALSAGRRAEKVLEVISEMFTSVEETVDGRNLKVVDVLERTRTNSAVQLRSEPEVLAEVKRALAKSYASLREQTPALEVLNEAVDLLQPVADRVPLLLAGVYNDLAFLYGETSSATNQIRAASNALHLLRGLPAPQIPEQSLALLQLGKGYQFLGEVREAKKYLAESVRINTQNRSTNDHCWSETVHQLGRAALAERNTETATRYLQQAIAAWESRPEPKEDPGPYYITMARVHMDQANYRLGRPLLEKSLAYRQAHYGSNHFRIAGTLIALAELEGYLTNWSQVASYAKQALDISRTCGDADAVAITTQAGNLLGKSLLAAGHISEGVEQLQQSYDLSAKLRTTNNIGTKRYGRDLADGLMRNREYARAEPLYLSWAEAAFNNRRQTFDPGLSNTVAARARKLHSNGYPELQLRLDRWVGSFTNGGQPNTSSR